jgi:hypothetical protein
MSNNRDDKYEGQDDSEYHFSDEEVSYEVESETPKSSPAAGGEQSAGVSRLAGSKRMLISFGVFIAIVYVVYRVFSPSSSTPAVDISTAPTVAETSSMPANPVTPAAPAPVATAAPTAPAAAPAATPAAAPVVAAPVASTTTTTTTTTPAAPVAQPAQPVPPAMVQQQTAPAPVAAALPPVIPVQSTVPASAQSAATTMSTFIEDKSAALTATSQQAIAQIQSQYTQQFNEFAAQNKSLQGQVQSLSTRVVEMEAQINQMVQILTRRNNNPGSSMNNQVPPPIQQVRSPDVKIEYNVQAIIPGRAWLKSENGETLTVAEGDVIRDVGRVTKIDPYDGVVEISTGTKAVSLSYGNGG